ncbi:glycoside hydrolase family 9 protein [Carboxylicivirga sp. M1479]|uniref:glycoside hydrolase family 9 protein n=1 Tax=Carboxylicivirga sp. M1479 TaxID=2594476 RepID=UPI001178CE1E|nr:glycoside hydrolase family 9 protein [Carboxylicivirga sp. M1479]TRX70964.1 chitobiase [Carboxylicivirga sp. M1479]
MSKSIILSLMAVILLACQAKKNIEADVLINHLGYHQNAYKTAIYQTTSTLVPTQFILVDEKGEEVYKGQFAKGGAIDQWHTGKAYKAVFSDFSTVGTYTLKVEAGSNTFASAAFEISAKEIAEDALPLLTKAFQLQRCKPPYDDKDKALSFYGDRTDKVDVSGGWYDASGEKGKYLSHLSFSNYMTPQQLPMMIWNMLETTDVIAAGNLKNKPSIINELNTEAAFGADYLVRIQDDEGYFYATIFAGWTKDPEQRQICAYEGQDGKRNDRYQAAFREGGGLAIAALSRCYSNDLSGEYSAKQYLQVAQKGYAHLKENNLKYCDDGKENIIDDYCALLAALELYAATEESNYLNDARQRAESLQARLMSDEACANWLRADDAGNRPFFHGAEAGLPIIAMCHYANIEQDNERKQQATAFIRQSVDFELCITKLVHNPFGYARQYVKAVNEESARDAFFITHVNETGYWWQGENARLASLATAMFKAQPFLSDVVKAESINYAYDQMNWILGLNPYDVGMLHGAGYNNPDYKEDGKSMNYLGGICNGITAGFDNENDIAFRPMPYDEDPAQRWRWSEQWLQHGGWMIPAMAYSTTVK